jgi:hypothetical protein
MEKQLSSRFGSEVAARLMPYVLAMIALATLAGCPSQRPPLEPDDWRPTPVEPEVPIVATTPDVNSLRPIVEQQRERLRALIDLAERREINEGGPQLLKAAKSQAQVLDQIETRLNQAAREGASDDEVDLIHDDLRRFSSRLSLLADALQ